MYHVLCETLWMQRYHYDSKGTKSYASCTRHKNSLLPVIATVARVDQLCCYCCPRSLGIGFLPSRACKCCCPRSLGVVVCAQTGSVIGRHYPSGFQLWNPILVLIPELLLWDNKAMEGVLGSSLTRAHSPFSGFLLTRTLKFTMVPMGFRILPASHSDTTPLSMY